MGGEWGCHGLPNLQTPWCGANAGGNQLKFRMLQGGGEGKEYGEFLKHELLTNKSILAH